MESKNDHYVHFLPEGRKHDAGMLADSGLLRDLEPHTFSPHGLIAELQRAKRASEAPWVRKIGNPIKPRKFGYDISVRPSERASERANVRTDSGGGGGASKECHLSLAVLCLEKSEKHSFLFAMSTNHRSG